MTNSSIILRSWLCLLFSICLKMDAIANVNKNVQINNSITKTMVDKYKGFYSYQDSFKICIILHGSLGKKATDTIYNTTYHTRFKRPSDLKYKLGQDTAFIEGIPMLQQNWARVQFLFDILPNLLLSNSNSPTWENFIIDGSEKIHNHRCFKLKNISNPSFFYSSWIDKQTLLLLKYRLWRLAVDGTTEMIIEYYPTKYAK